MREVGTREPRQEEEVEEAAIEPLEELIKLSAFSEAFGIFGQWDPLLKMEDFRMRSLLS